MSTRRTPRGVTVLLALAAVSGCSDIDEVADYRRLGEQSAASREVYEAIPVDVLEAARVIVSDGATAVEVVRSSATWQPGRDATDVSVALMAEAEAILLPTLAYRRLTVDSSDRAFGLIDSTTTVDVETHTAQRFRLTLGGPTPNRGGYYAQRDDEPFVYVVVPQVLDYVRSIATGDRVIRPGDPELQAALDAVAETEQPEEVINPWLAQALDAS
jgi:hypothetical protein